MTYSVKEIFLTLQGEGAQAGRRAVFLRFSGCNLWTGLEKDRATAAGSCGKWCDTFFVGCDGVNGGKYSAKELADRVVDVWSNDERRDRFVVLTGGEPALQLDPTLLLLLEQRFFFVAVETNGTRLLPATPNWITVSPKAGQPILQTFGDELKLVFPQPELMPDHPDIQHIERGFDRCYIQPMDGPALAENTFRAVAYCQKHPRWRLSLQQHKLLNLP